MPCACVSLLVSDLAFIGPTGCGKVQPKTDTSGADTDSQEQQNEADARKAITAANGHDGDAAAALLQGDSTEALRHLEFPTLAGLKPSIRPVE
ncbi:MAG: hypothetical protein ACPG4T_01515 [Nannocystaceae bacterium]